jgi:cytochrome c oxidase subunit II
MAGHRSLRRLAPIVGLVALAAAGCAEDAPQDTMAPEGPAARTLDNLITPVFGIAAVVFVVILGGCLFVALKFRARDDNDFDEIPTQIHGNMKAEIGWTIAPAVILAVVGVFTVSTIFALAADAEEEAVRVEVHGAQWWWEYRYDTDGDGQYDDIITANDLVIPTGREVDLRITARDVIHSWWAPKLNGKRDAVPGRIHRLTIEADQVDEYLGQCTEYCGLSHANMRLKVISVTPERYEQWVEEQQQNAGGEPDSSNLAAVQGYEQFNSLLCSSCHRIQGVNDDRVPADEPLPPNLQVSGYAPDLTHLMSRTTFAGAMFDLRLDTEECRAQGIDWDPDACLDVAALEAWLRNPPGQKALAPDPVPGRTGVRGMPNLNLTEEQIDQLVAYLRTLK